VSINKKNSQFIFQFSSTLFLFVSTSKVIIFLFWTFRKVKITLLFYSGNTCFSFYDGPVFETLFIYQRKDQCVFKYRGNEKVIGFTIINLFSWKTLFRDVNMFQDFHIASLSTGKWKTDCTISQNGIFSNISINVHWSLKLLIT